MLLAIDIGNTKAAFGVWFEGKWHEMNQWPTENLASNLELNEWLKRLKPDHEEIRVSCASVKPSSESEMAYTVLHSVSSETQFLRTADDFGITSLYSSELGSDRLANIVGALEQFQPPIIVVDVGTATTIDAVDKDGVHIGGLIIAGPQFSIDALLERSELMKATKVRNHRMLFSLNTAEALSNGHFLGHHYALEGIVKAMRSEVQGNVTVVTTGGLGKLFCEASKQLGEYKATLTLDGIRIAANKRIALE